MPKTNELFCISEGIYSDYRLMGHFKALKDFSMKDEGEKYISLDRGTKLRPQGFKVVNGARIVNMVEMPIEASVDGFQAHLIKEGFAEPFDVEEYWANDGYDFKGFERD